MKGQEQPKHESKRSSRVLPIILLVVSLCVFLVSGGVLLSNYLENQRSQDEVTELKKYVSVAQSTQDEDKDVQTEETEPLYAVDFDGLMALNPDVAGWIISPGTVIDYPVMHTDDNDDYLRRSFSGEKNRCGCIFIDQDNAKGLADTNTVIHGHRMRDGSMFGSLDQYAKQSYYEEHPVMYLVMPDGCYRLEIFAAYEARWDAGQTQKVFADDAQFEEFITICREKSDISTSVVVKPGDKIVTF
ncbi:MAG: class B sortase, partial [Christensenellaceae bacterium]|nr:class B sortase [Christensenellaceae bacterium]